MNKPRWIFGIDMAGNDYLFSLERPRFVCRVASAAVIPACLAPVCHTLSTGERFVDFTWFDAQPNSPHLETLLSAAELVWRDYAETTRPEHGPTLALSRKR